MAKKPMTKSQTVSHFAKKFEISKFEGDVAPILPLLVDCSHNIDN